MSNKNKNTENMATTNAELMQKAKESLRDKWGLAIGTFIIYFLIVGAIQAARPIGSLASLVITGPMMLGISIFSLSLSRNEEAKLEQIFKGFNNFGTALAAYLLMVLYILLWTLLLIIPGIIAAISYSMTFYILADDPAIGAKKALDKSEKMMYGYKWKLFYLGLRFFGWALLCILTLGIGFLWLVPWINVTTAKFYDDLKANQSSAENI